MVKVLWSLAIILNLSNASQSFEEVCVKCHDREGIPNIAVYNRYLVKYSSEARIKKIMIDYLKNPTTQKTIMPPRFINKFGLKKAMNLSDDELEKYVGELIDRYSLKKKLYIETN